VPAEPMNVACMDCGGDYAQPVFTTALSKVRPSRGTWQPKWYCDNCRKKHHRVSPTTGQRVVAYQGLHRERIVVRRGVTVSGEKAAGNGG